MSEPMSNEEAYETLLRLKEWLETQLPQNVRCLMCGAFLNNTEVRAHAEAKHPEAVREFMEFETLQ